jgi:anti-anti-sigma factor
MRPASMAPSIRPRSGTAGRVGGLGPRAGGSAGGAGAGRGLGGAGAGAAAGAGSGVGGTAAAAAGGAGGTGAGGSAGAATPGAAASASAASAAAAGAALRIASSDRAVLIVPTVMSRPRGAQTFSNLIGTMFSPRAKTPAQPHGPPAWRAQGTGAVGTIGGAMPGSGTTVEDRDDVTVVSLAGAVDVYSAREVEASFDGIDPAGRQAVVDMSRVTLIDSAGMRALVRMRNRAREGGRDVGIVCPRLELRRIMELVGLVDGFVVADDLHELRTALADPCRALAPVG